MILTQNYPGLNHQFNGFFPFCFQCKIFHFLNNNYAHALHLQTSTANLERVRKMKTRHQRLQTRVVTVREELQSFLEDDDDMLKMCLTHRMEQDQLQQQQGLIRAQGAAACCTLDPRHKPNYEDLDSALAC